MSASSMAVLLKPVVEQYAPFLKKEVIREPRELDRSSFDRVKHVSKKTHDIEIFRDINANYFVSLDVKDKGVTRGFEKRKITRASIAKDFQETFNARSGKLKESYDKMAKKFIEARNAKPSKRKKVSKEFLKEVKEFSKELRKKTKVQILKNKSYQNKMDGLSDKIKSDVYTLLDDVYRKDLKANMKPKITLMAESDLEYMLLGDVQSNVNLDDVFSMNFELPVDDPLHQDMYNGKLFDKDKLIGKKKAYNWRKVGTFLLGTGAVAIGAYLTYLMFKRGTAVVASATQELASAAGTQAGFLRAMAEATAELKDALYGMADDLHDEAQGDVDIDNDGLLDYVEDFDLDNDGNPDINLANGDIIDLDAPINNKALAMFNIEVLGNTTDPNLNLQYAGWKEAIVKWDEANEIYGIADSIGVDTDMDGKIDFLLMKDGEGNWVFDPAGDVDLDNDGNPDIIIEQTDGGVQVWKLNDMDSNFGAYANAAVTNMTGVEPLINGRISELATAAFNDLDIDGDHEMDYVTDFDLDNDGNPDINLANGDIIDLDAPVNWKALGMYNVDVLNNTTDPYLNLMNAEWKEAYSQLETAQDLQDFLTTEFTYLTTGLDDLRQEIVNLQGPVLQKAQQLEAAIKSSAIYPYIGGGLAALQAGLTATATAGKWLIGQKTIPYLLNSYGDIHVEMVK